MGALASMIFLVVLSLFDDDSSTIGDDAKRFLDLEDENDD